MDLFPKSSSLVGLLKGNRADLGSKSAHESDNSNVIQWSISAVQHSKTNLLMPNSYVMDSTISESEFYCQVSLHLPGIFFGILVQTINIESTTT